jgi:CRP-like cAMP-binding protein/uncharacterized membrane protein YdbT with pleckstrin-like domain
MTIPSVEERLSQFSIFDDFTGDELAQVAHFVEERTFPQGRTLFRQGDLPGFFYLLESGAVQEVGKDPSGTDLVRRRTEAGDYVGHRATMDDVPYPTTAEVLQTARTLAMQAGDFSTLLAMYPRLQERLRRTRVVNRLLGIPLFGSFSVDQLFDVADLVRVVEYPRDQVIFQQGEPADAFYVIDTGQVIERASGSVPGKQTWPKYLSAGSFFGRYSLLNNTNRRATAEAASDVRLFRLSADAFHWLRQSQPGFEQALRRHNVLDYLRNTTIGANLSNEELKRLAGYVGVARFRPGDVLYRQGEIDPTLYMLYEGEAIIRARDEGGKDRPRGYLKAGDAVGESSLFLKEPRDVTVEATTETHWFYLTCEDLDQFLAQEPDLAAKVVPREEVAARWRMQRLPWMEPDELLVMMRRRHWFFLVARLAFPWLMIIAGLILATFPPPPRIAGYVLFAVAFLWILWRLIDWLNDYYVVTTARVIHREKKLFLWETRDETPLDKVQNINIDRGLIGNTFGFGKLVIDTAAAVAATRVTFDYLADPEDVQALIFEQMSRALAGERVEMYKVIRDKLEESIRMAIRPRVPHPAVPSPAPSTAPPPSRPGVVDSLGELTLGRLFWIEKRLDDRIIWRKHWIRLLLRIWMPLLAIAALVLALFIYFAGVGASSGWLGPVLVGLLVLTFAWLWWSWEDWGNDQYIVTNDRIIDVEALPAGFRRKTTETKFDRIQNVSFEIPNPIATVLNYGTVVIYTAGVEGRLDFEWVRAPSLVQAEIFRRLAVYEEQQRHKQREERWADMPQWFAVYEETYRSG